MTAADRARIAEILRDLPADHPAHRADVRFLFGDDALAWGGLDRTTLPGELRWSEYGIVGYAAPEWVFPEGLPQALERAWREEMEAQRDP